MKNTLDPGQGPPRLRTHDAAIGLLVALPSAVLKLTEGLPTVGSSSPGLWSSLAPATLITGPLLGAALARSIPLRPAPVRKRLGSKHRTARHPDWQLPHRADPADAVGTARGRSAAIMGYLPHRRRGRHRHLRPATAVPQRFPALSSAYFSSGAWSGTRPLVSRKRHWTRCQRSRDELVPVPSNRTVLGPSDVA